MTDDLSSETGSTGNGGDRMVVSRTYDAPRELVWQIWTDPEYATQWWGPRGFTVPFCKMDLRVGGKFLLCMETPDGQKFWSAGEYHEIVPQEKIVFTMYFADPDGNKVEPEQYGITHEAIADVDDVVAFEDLGDGQTRLTFTGNETMESAVESGQVEGMNQSLDKLGDVLAVVVK